MANTVDFGIDLGTTNSAIARMTPRGAEVIPVRRLNYIPSLVAVDKHGDLKVGTDAQNPLLSQARWFKRLMGSSSKLRLDDGQNWSPERLSAEVLKALKAAAKLKTNLDVEDVVITVPAMFNQPQCAATHDAAQLAGLNPVALLQEPIAASTAYLSERPSEGKYLVYDLGGGTFDVSLIRLHGGEMNVLEHGGDNYLGGADLDRSVFDWVLDQIDRKGGDVSLFEPVGSNRAKLMQACEDARVALSDEPIATIYLDDFDLPLAKIDLALPTLEDLIEPLVTKTIQISKDRLAQVPASDLRAILLVGGPTQMPYIRRRLESELGVPLDVDQDPMTVVAKGAAIHASTIFQTAKTLSMPSAEPGVARLELFYEAVSPDPYTSVAGRVVSPAGFGGEVRIRSTRDDWESGWSPLINGSFSVELNLGTNQVSEFAVELRDPTGKLVACEPSSFVIRSGVRAAQPVTPYEYGVVLEGGKKVGRIVAAGEPLPASGFSEYRLARPLLAGSKEEAKIYFVEGRSSLAEENVRVGEITISGSGIHRTLRENERIEVRMRMDESRRMKATVYVPLLDEEFSVELRSAQEAPDPDDLVAAIRETEIAIGELEEHVGEEDQPLLLRASREVEQLENILDRVRRGEVGEADRIHKQLSDTKASIRPLRERYGLLAKHRMLIELIEDSEELCDHFNDRMGKAKLQDHRTDADRAFRLQNEDTLDSIRDRVRDIFWEHYGKTPECWHYQVQLMRERAPMARDPLKYAEVLHRAEQALDRQDYGEARIQVLHALELVPKMEQLRNRFHDAAVR